MIVIPPQRTSPRADLGRDGRAGDLRKPRRCPDLTSGYPTLLASSGGLETQPGSYTKDVAQPTFRPGPLVGGLLMPANGLRGPLATLEAALTLLQTAL